MASYPKVLESINSESSDLKTQLAGLSATQQRNLVANRKVALGWVKQSDFLDRNARLANVSSRVGHESLQDTLRSKKERLEQQRAELELAGCTFRPELNKNTEALLSSYVSVMEKPLPRKEPPASHSSRMEVEQPSQDRTASAEELRPRARPNPQFYEQKMEWKSGVEEARLRVRLQREEAEQTRPVAKPHTNSARNKELVKAEGDFLTRVQKDLERSKAVRGRLEEKLYGSAVCSFAPKIKAVPGVASKIRKA